MRILLFPSAIGRAHLNRLILIAQELQHQGIDIAFGFQNPNDSTLEEYNFAVFPIADATITDFSANVFAAFTPTLIEQCVKDELKIIETFQPDAIVGDFRLTAAISAKVAGIPYISVVNAYMTDYFDPVDVMMSKDKNPWQYRLASVTGKAIQSTQKKQLATPFREVAQKYHLKKLVSLYDFLTGDSTLIADSPEFCPLENLPQNFRYIGPLIWEGFNQTVPEYINQINPNKTIIYATTGNTGKKKLIQLVIDGFKNDLNYEVILTTGAFIHPDTVPKSGNIHVARFLPGSQVMKHCQAAIHCGGNGTVYQALSQGIPAVVIPFNNDQMINGWLIKKHQVGIPLSPSKLTGEQIKLAVKQVIATGEIKKNLQYFKNVLAKTNGAKFTVEQILSFLKVD